jgi:hypothetical protein
MLYSFDIEVVKWPTKIDKILRAEKGKIELYSIYHGSKSASSVATEHSIMLSLESYKILFSTFFQYLYANEKFKHI